MKRKNHNVCLFVKHIWWSSYCDMNSKSTWSDSMRSTKGNASMPDNPGWMPQSSCKKTRLFIEVLFISISLIFTIIVLPLNSSIMHDRPTSWPAPLICSNTIVLKYILYIFKIGYNYLSKYLKKNHNLININYWKTGIFFWNESYNLTKKNLQWPNQQQIAFLRRNLSVRLSFCAHFLPDKLNDSNRSSF